MSVLDKVIAAVTPPESEAERAQARAKAQGLAHTCGWLADVLRHHVRIEEAFAAVAAANEPAGRRLAQRALSELLTAHSMAEEAVLYPAMALGDQKAHSVAAYTEQSGAKVNLAALETLDPMSQDYLDKLEHVRGAVAHHVYEEEDKWFPGLVESGGEALQIRLAARYREEFSHYVGSSGRSPEGGAPLR